MMKGPINHIVSLFTALLMLVCVQSFGQTTEEEYLKSDPQKKEFSTQQWKKLKGKMKQESSGNNAGNNDFSPQDFNGEETPEGDNYNYETEEYKGEYSEYQSYEGEDQQYEYDEEYDDYEHYENDYYNYEEHDDGKYNQYEKPKNKDNSFTPPKKRSKPKASNTELGSGDVGFMQVLLIIIGAILLAFIVYYLFMRIKEDSDGAKIIPNFDDVPPSEIPKTELERRLEEALEKGDYREAVRIYFIFIIKDLADKNWIKWERKKTNFSYLIEMRSRSQYALFDKSVSIFEVVWYGHYEINEKTYKEVEPTFKKLLSEIHR